MSRLSLPMRVTPLSCVVPRFTVTDSRNTLRSPISRRVGSPLYFLSCGASPSEANWNILLSRPIRVGPLITACGPIQVPEPMTTSAPITENGPISTSAATCACGETTARESIILPLALLRRLGLGRDHDLRGRHFLAVDLRQAVEFPNPLEGALQLHPQHQLVSRFDGLAKSRIVDGDKVKTRIDVGHDLGGLEGQNTRCLRQGLDDQNSRHHRPVRKMSLKERLVDRYILERQAVLSCDAFQDSIHQQEGIPMRQLPHDRCDIQSIGLRHYFS